MYVAENMLTGHDAYHRVWLKIITRNSFKLFLKTVRYKNSRNHRLTITRIFIISLKLLINEKNKIMLDNHSYDSIGRPISAGLWDSENSTD